MVSRLTRMGPRGLPTSAHEFSDRPCVHVTDGHIDRSNGRAGVQVGVQVSGRGCMMAKTMPHDTSMAARKAQYEVYRRMTPETRVEIAVQMSEDARRITEAGLRARHPELSGVALEKRLLRVVLGDALYAKAGIDDREQ